MESIVIPHGTTWGFYTPPDSSWDKQLTSAQHDPQRQTLIEIYSGHGNSEEFRDWSRRSQSARRRHRALPRAAQRLPALVLARRRDHAAALRERGQGGCGVRGDRARARATSTRRPDWPARWSVPGETGADWLDSGQCRDCFLPAFNYRPKNSVQYIEALTNFDEPEGPKRFRFGFIASSDNHSARPGTGYKEYARTDMTEQRGAKSPDQARIARRARPRRRRSSRAASTRARSRGWARSASRRPSGRTRSGSPAVSSRFTPRAARATASGTRSSARRPTARAARGSCSGSTL